MNVWSRGKRAHMCQCLSFNLLGNKSRSQSKKVLGARALFLHRDQIKSGEEMTINYLPLDWESAGASTAQDRREVLKEDWGFDCMCERCVRETSG
jgi:hypothetical protein